MLGLLHKLATALQTSHKFVGVLDPASGQITVNCTVCHKSWAVTAIR